MGKGSQKGPREALFGDGGDADGDGEAEAAISGNGRLTVQRHVTNICSLLLGIQGKI